MYLPMHIYTEILHQTCAMWNIHANVKFGCRGGSDQISFSSSWTEHACLGRVEPSVPPSARSSTPACDLAQKPIY